MKTNLTTVEIDIRDQLWLLDLAGALKKFKDLTKDYTDLPAMRVLCRVSLFFLIVKILGWKEYVHDWSYQRVLDVDQEPNGCIDLWARGHGKSSIITIAKTIQDMLLVDDLAVIVFAHTFSKARKNTRVIKQTLESNKLLITLFPDRFYDDPRKQSPVWNESQFIIKRQRVRGEPSVMTCGFDRALPTGAHADVLVYDDVVTEQSVTTSEQIDKTKEMYGLSKALGTMDSVERIIGTRYAFNDLFADMIESQSYTVREHPATLDGSMTGPLVMFTEKKWQDVTKPPATQRMISNQYLLNPLSAEDRVFNIDNLMTYEVREQRMTVCILVDPGVTKKKGSCDTAMVVLGIGGKKRKYLLDGLCHRMNLGERYKALRYLFNKWRSAAGVVSVLIGYETYGAGQSDVEAINELQKREPGHRMRIQEINTPQIGSAAKRDRIERIQPDLDNHMIFIPLPPVDQRFTSKQRQALMSGNEDLIAQRILVKIGRLTKDEQGKLTRGSAETYDLVLEFKKQLQHFPLGSKVDLLDAFSRVYDLAVHDPNRRTGSVQIADEELT